MCVDFLAWQLKVMTCTTQVGNSDILTARFMRTVSSAGSLDLVFVQETSMSKGFTLFLIGLRAVTSVQGFWYESSVDDEVNTSYLHFI